MNNDNMTQRKKRILTLTLAAGAALLLLVSLKLPLWQIHLEAPQYRGEEALNIAVHPNVMRGDLQELTILNQYIGVNVPPTLPQFQWLPIALMVGAALAIGAALLPLRLRRVGFIVSVVALSATLAVAVFQARAQIYNIGHNRNPHAPMTGVHDFTPPFLGKAKIAQFEVVSSLQLGAWLIGVALALQLGAAGLSGVRKRGVVANNSKTLDQSISTKANRPASVSVS